jgi:hypothetical protein
MEAIRMTTSTYPVRVDATLDSPLNRWLWLVKWAMVIPHYLVLAFLWTAFLVLSVVAFFAIAFTGRYPRSIFDFNVGVLRWTWRVAYFAYGALGTDRYPPFSLQDRADYPARLDIDYPEHLSRRLVLVKWWLLAIPHYLVVAVFLGGGVYVANQAMISQNAPWLWGGGLIGLLVLLAAVVLLFTGRYPRDIFDLVLGMNRWVLRVAAYAGLMTDAYPPFRLDMGPDDPGSGRLRFDATAGPTPPPAPRPSTAPWTTGRIVAVTTGSVLLALSGGLVAGGITLAVADHGLRDDAGFVTSASETFSTADYAITTENLEFHVSNGAEWLPRSLLGDTRLTVDADDPVFLGIAATGDVERYLAGVPHAVLTDYRGDGFGGTPSYRDVAGSDVPVPPAQLGIWVARTTGAGQRSLTWTPRNGDWTAVLMNADGTTGVRADVRAGAELPFLDWAVPVLLSVGGTLLVLSVALIAGGLLAGRREQSGS